MREDLARYPAGFEKPVLRASLSPLRSEALEGLGEGARLAAGVVMSAFPVTLTDMVIFASGALFALLFVSGWRF